MAAPSPQMYTPAHLIEKILASQAALEGECKQVTVLFADLRRPDVRFDDIPSACMLTCMGWVLMAKSVLKPPPQRYGAVVIAGGVPVSSDHQGTNQFRALRPEFVPLSYNSILQTRQRCCASHSHLAPLPGGWPRRSRYCSQRKITIAMPIAYAINSVRLIAAMVVPLHPASLRTLHDGAAVHVRAPLHGRRRSACNKLTVAG
jgi:hypothetical protein